jgi:hypothetical protein
MLVGLFGVAAAPERPDLRDPRGLGMATGSSDRIAPGDGGGRRFEEQGCQVEVQGGAGMLQVVSEVRSSKLYQRPRSRLNAIRLILRSVLGFLLFRGRWVLLPFLQRLVG